MGNMPGHQGQGGPFGGQGGPFGQQQGGPFGGGSPFGGGPFGQQQGGPFGQQQGGLFGQQQGGPFGGGSPFGGGQQGGYPQPQGQDDAEQTAASGGSGRTAPDLGGTTAAEGYNYSGRRVTELRRRSIDYGQTTLPPEFLARFGARETTAEQGGPQIVTRGAVPHTSPVKPPDYVEDEEGLREARDQGGNLPYGQGTVIQAHGAPFNQGGQGYPQPYGQGYPQPYPQQGQGYPQQYPQPGQGYPYPQQGYQQGYQPGYPPQGQGFQGQQGQGPLGGMAGKAGCAACIACLTCLLCSCCQGMLGAGMDPEQSGGGGGGMDGGQTDDN